MKSKFIVSLFLFLCLTMTAEAVGHAVIDPAIVKFTIPVIVRPLTMHKEVTAVFDDLNWGRYPTSLTVEVVNWQLPKPDEKNAVILKYLEANQKDLQAFVGGEMGGKNIKALGNLPNLLGGFSPNARITGTLEVWAYESPEIDKGQVRVRLIGITSIEKR